MHDWESTYGARPWSIAADREGEEFMYTITVHDTLSGSTEAMCIDQVNTKEEAHELGALSFEEVAIECQEDRFVLRKVFMKMAKLMRSGLITHAGLDGYEVRVTGPEESDAYGEFTQYASVLKPEEANMFLGYLMAQADPKYGAWLVEMYGRWVESTYEIKPENLGLNYCRARGHTIDTINNVCLSCEVI